MIGVLVIIGGVYFYYMRDHKSPAGVGTNLKNATYTILGTPTTLTNGVSEVPLGDDTAAKQITKYFGNEVEGDFNNDGYSDTAFLLTQENGGSGTFFYLAVTLGSVDGIRGTNAIMLGDRIAPQNSTLIGNRIIVNYADRKAGEAMTTAPSVGVSRQFYISEGSLIEQKMAGTESWKTKIEYNMSFQYPEKVGTYIEATEWPPRFDLAASVGLPFSCTDSEAHTVHEQLYCVTSEVDAAAGSMYTTYTYSTEVEDVLQGRNVYVFTFTLRTPQCANYDGSEKDACIAEQKTFDLDGLVDQMVGTVQFL